MMKGREEAKEWQGKRMGIKKSRGKGDSTNFGNKSTPV